MYPNPQDAIPLTPRPNLDQYKRRAKDLLKAARSGGAQAIRRWVVEWLSAISRQSHFPNLESESLVNQLEEFAARKLQSNSVLADAQFVIARAHGFDSWPKFSKHVTAFESVDSPVASFERAADAIVSGDLATLKRLVKNQPDLIHAHSTREHGAALLHYISANGVENYRQRTPSNIVAIAEYLLQAGADVDACANAYGGSTTLGLVATSVHPERAGVQAALIDLLLQHGASMNGVAAGHKQRLLVNICLANGRGRAAAYLADRGAALDLEAASGVGRLDMVKSLFAETGGLRSRATKMQMERGFLWACEYGRNEVVEFLLAKAVSLETQANTGLTAIHWAVVGRQLKTIKLLLAHGASLKTKNAYGGTALGQALWSAANDESGTDYVDTVKLLLESGAKVEDGMMDWLTQQKRMFPVIKSRLMEVLVHHSSTRSKEPM